MAVGVPPRLDRGSSLRVGLLVLVWLTVASGAIVFTEPAPVDILSLFLIGLLPLMGLVSIKRSLIVLLTLWMTAAAAALVASIFIE